VVITVVGRQMKMKVMGNKLEIMSRKRMRMRTLMRTVDDSSISRVVEILQCFAKPAVLLDYSLEVR
jgi:hypothetical protein